MHNFGHKGPYNYERIGINGKIDGEISESGIFIKDITLSYSPENTDIDIYSLNLEKFQFGFSDFHLGSRSWSVVST